MGLTAEMVHRIFSHLESGSGDRFFQHVADDVDWTVEGTHPLAGRYRSKADFHAHTFARLNKILPGGTQLRVQQVLIDGNWAVVELRSHATARTACASTIGIAGSCASMAKPLWKCAPIWIRHWCRS